MSKFYDTSSLLLLYDFSEPIVFSSISLKELEEIKTSNHKSEEVRSQARRILNALNDNAIKHETIIYNNSMLKPIEKANLDINNDSKILATALYYKRSNPECIFVTNDLALKAIASCFFNKDNIQSIIPIEDTYTGYVEVAMSDEALAEFYNNLNQNKYGIKTNQYIVIRNADGEVVDKMCWTGSTFRPVKYYTFCSHYLGEIKPKTGDIYQVLAMDSLVNNQITLLKGAAGTGKSMLAMAYLFNQLYKHKIDKIIVF